MNKVSSNSNLLIKSNKNLTLKLKKIKTCNFSTNLKSNSHIGNKPINYNDSIKFITSLNSNSNRIKNLEVIGPKGQLSIKIHPFINLNNLSNQTISATTTNTTSTTPHKTGTIISSLSPLDKTFNVTVLDPTNKFQRSIWGLTRSLISNAIIGVSTGYTLSLKLVGVGYRATLEDVSLSLHHLSNLPSTLGTPNPTQRLNLKLGYAHPVLIELPFDVVAEVPSSTSIILSGSDKQRLGEIAARIRNWRVPEPYNGKGIFVGAETIKRKEVKKK